LSNEQSPIDSTWSVYCLVFSTSGGMGHFLEVAGWACKSEARRELFSDNGVVGFPLPY